MNHLAKHKAAYARSLATDAGALAYRHIARVEAVANAFQDFDISPIVLA